MASRERSDDRVYLRLVKELSGLLEAARRSSTRAVSAVMTATYWEVGRPIVEFEQAGAARAGYAARASYHREALRGGWSVRKLDRQIATQFYERTAPTCAIRWCTSS